MKFNKFLMLLSLILVSIILLSCKKMNNTTEVLPLNNHSVIKIAHRGVPSLYPENTLGSFHLAKELEADYIEIDIQMSKDGVIVVLHDETVNRTTNGIGEINIFTVEELQNLSVIYNHFDALFEFDFEHALTIPTLEQVFMLFGDSVNYFIETKNPDKYSGLEEELLRLLENYQLLNHDPFEPIPKVVIQSFDKNSLLKIHELNPDIPLIQLYRRTNVPKFNSQTLLELQSYASGVGMHYSIVNKKLIDRLHSNNLEIYIYTVNDPKLMGQLINLQVDGIITDAMYDLNNVVGMN